MFICSQCKPTETIVGDIVMSLPRQSSVRDHQDTCSVPMDEQCVEGEAVCCRQLGEGPHLIHLNEHIKYGTDEQVRISHLVKIVMNNVSLLSCTAYR